MSKGLGKGLSALISENKVNVAANVSEPAGDITTLPVGMLKPGKFQPREQFDEEQLIELAASVKKNGVVQPIIVRKIIAGRYEIIAGERRWRASKLAGLESIPVVVMDLDDKKALEISLVENIQRQNLNAVEVAEGYQRLVDEFSYTQEVLSEMIGKSRSHVANSLRILSLPEEVKGFLRDAKLTFGHARTLIGLENAVELAEKIVAKNLNVRQAEALVREQEHQKAKKKKANPKAPEIIHIEKSLKKKIGVNVDITNRGKKGKVVLSYKSLEELDKILDVLEGK